MAVISGNRDVQKEKYWSEIIEKYKESGKSQAQFCKDESLSVHKFYYWSGVLAKRHKRKNQTKPLEDKTSLPFVALKVPKNLDFSNKSDTAGQIEISKLVLRMSASADKSTLDCILQSLGKA